MGSLLRVFGNFLVNLLRTYAGQIGLQVLLFFGLSYVTHTLPALPDFVSQMQGSMTGAPASAIKALAAVRFDRAVMIILNAYAARYVGGVVWRLVPRAGRVPVPVAQP